MTDHCQVDANLMSATGVWLYLDKRGITKCFEDAVAGFRRTNDAFHAFSFGCRRLAVAARGAGDWGSDGAFFFFRTAKNEREIALVYFSIFEKSLERRERFFGTGDDKNSARVAIKSVDNTGAIRFANGANFRIVRDDPIGNRAAFSRDRRVNLDADGFVYDKKVRGFFDDSDGEIGFGK